MDQESIKKTISGLGQSDFDRVVSLVCKRIFNLSIIEVDGAGDGGSDLRSFTTSQGNLVWASTVYQVTVTRGAWQAKALDDAKKAHEKLGAKQYFFLTSQPHQNTSLIAVQSKIANEVGIPATCLGANEFAALICESDLKQEFYEAIDLRLDVDVKSRPDRREILLYAFSSLSGEKKDLEQGVYDDAIVVTVYDVGGKIARSELVEKAIELLGTTTTVKERLSRRVDSLLARQRLVLENGIVALSRAERSELDSSAGVYVRELESLGAAQQQILSEQRSMSWTAQQCQETAVLLSRCFIKNQLMIAERASLPLSKIGFAQNLGEPAVELKQLLRNAGLTIAQSGEIFEQFVKLFSDLPLIQKLARAITFIACEGKSIERASKALGAASWSEVTVTLDTSVAIPFLCSSFFAPTQGRFSIGANECIDILGKLGANLVMPYMYINETAAHLVRAVYFPEDELFDKAAEASRNGFVSHYHQLKNRGHNVPKTLREFVSAISATAPKGNGNIWDTAKRTMPDIQRLLSEYHVKFESIEVFSSEHSDYSNFRRPVEESFTYHLHQLGKSKAARLLKNDINVLAFSRKQLSQGEPARVCLTWDAAMIAVASDLADCGWVVTPNEAADLVSTSVDSSTAKLTSLAHVIAKADSDQVRIGAQILDRVTNIAKSKLLDWEVKEKFKLFYKDLVERTLASSDLGSDIDGEIEKFLRENHVLVTDADDAETNEAH